MCQKYLRKNLAFRSDGIPSLRWMHQGSGTFVCTFLGSQYDTTVGSCHNIYLSAPTSQPWYTPHMGILVLDQGFVLCQRRLIIIWQRDISS